MSRSSVLLLILCVVAVLGQTFDSGWKEAEAGSGRGGGVEPCTAENGDINGDGTVNITDAITLLGYLFEGRPPELLPLCTSPAECACVDFDALSAGTQWGAPAGHSPGDLVYSENSIDVFVHDFAFVGGGGTFNSATVDGPIGFVGSGSTVNTNNINLEFDFSKLPFTPGRVTFEFADLGGSENISINGMPVPIFAGELDSFPCAGGLTCTFLTTPVSGGSGGTAIIQGNVNTLRIGGQELWIDNVCAWPSDAEPPEEECIEVADIPAVASATVITHEGVEFHATEFTPGNFFELSVGDRFPIVTDGVNEVWVPNSESAALRLARIEFPPAVFGAGPTQVRIDAAHYFHLRLEAYDDAGVLLDAADHTAGQNTIQSLLLTGGNIREVRILGAEITINEVCADR